MKREESEATAKLKGMVGELDVVTADHLQAGDSQCSFCKKWQSEVEMLIGSADGVFICNECVDVCVKILKEQNGNDT